MPACFVNFCFFVFVNPVSSNTNAASPASLRPNQTSADIGLPQNDATLMLAESIGKIQLGDKKENFMNEAGKIISNMLEARLAGNIKHPLSNASSNQSLKSNSSLNLNKSPMVMRKRLDLDDFKNIDPTKPAALEPVISVPSHSQTSPKPFNAVDNKTMPQISATKPIVAAANNGLTTGQPVNHPMGKVLGLCNEQKNLSHPKPITVAAACQEESKASAPLESVVFRNTLGGAKKAGNSSHNVDRRSYIEPNVNAQATDAANKPAFSISVKALGPKANGNANEPLSPENEQVVNQLLQEGKAPICCQCNKEIKS